MVRRKPYTKVEKEGQHRPEHVDGMGDVVFKGFQCLKSDCHEFIFVRKDEIIEDFIIKCPKCNYKFKADGSIKFFDYKLINKNEDSIIEEDEFIIPHLDYINEAQEYKYCILCYTLKPINYFDKHTPRKSGKQGECRLCKAVYNGIKNQSRISDQHREASQRRRLYKIISGESSKIDSKKVFEKFGNKCFNCGKSLDYQDKGSRDYGLDHTCPARYLWPINSDNATLLCSSCNNGKHDHWPSTFYSTQKLKTLARLTGFEYKLLAGPPQLNSDSVESILKDVDAFIEEWIHYPNDIKKVRKLIKEEQSIDIFDHASTVPNYLRED